MKEAQCKIISTLIENKRQFDVPVEQRSRVERTANVKQWKPLENLSLDAKGHTLFEGEKL